MNETCEYEFVKAHRRDAYLLWLPNEKHLYSKKMNLGNGKIDFICYQNYMAQQNPKIQPCTSRVQIDANQICYRKSIPHSTHENHELKYKDLFTKNQIVDKCIAFKKLFMDLPISVPSRDIFTLELSK